MKKTELEAGQLVTLNTKQSFLLIPNKEDLQLVHVKTNPESYDLVCKKVDVLTWLCSLKNVNEDLSINICNSTLYI